MEPFYGCMIIFLIIELFELKRWKIASVFISIILSFIFFAQLKKISKIYQKQNIQHKLFSEKLLEVSDEFKEGVFLERFYFEYIDNKVLDKVRFNNIGVVNFYLMNSTEAYQNYWDRLCNCNPLRISEKIEYIIKSNKPIIIERHLIEVYLTYLYAKYGMEVYCEEIRPFFNDLVIVKLLV
jgi:hypothetical protein